MLIITDRNIFNEVIFDVNTAFIAAFNINVNSLFMSLATVVINFATEVIFVLKTFAVLIFLMLFFKT